MNAPRPEEIIATRSLIVLLARSVNSVRANRLWSLSSSELDHLIYMVIRASADDVKIRTKAERAQSSSHGEPLSKPKFSELEKMAITASHSELFVSKAPDLVSMELRQPYR